MPMASSGLPIGKDLSVASRKFYIHIHSKTDIFHSQKNRIELQGTLYEA